MGFNDVDSLTPYFNSLYISILDKVPPVKSNLASLKNPWMKETAEPIWKSTKLKVHRLYLRELMTF